MKKIRIAQIGTQHDHAIPTMETLRQLSDIFELVGVANPDRDAENPVISGLEHPAYQGVPVYPVEDLLDMNLDAVVIETWEKASTQYAQMALDRGIHVQMDKPGSESQEEFEKMVLTAKEKNLVFHTGYMYRYNPSVQKLLKSVKDGEFGEIYSVEAHMNCLHNPQKRQWLSQYKGGMLFFLGCHLIDLILQFQGMPEKIIPLSTATGFDGVTGEDFGMAVFQYKNGVSFAKTTATEPGGFMRRQLVVCGSKKTAEIQPLEAFEETPEIQYSRIREIDIETASQKGWGYSEAWQEFHNHHRYRDMLVAFAKMVRGEIENPWSYEYEIKLHEIILKACGY